MNNLLFGLKLSTNNIRRIVMQEQMQNKLTNEAMCIILKDLLVDFEDAVITDYANAIAHQIAENDKEKKEEKEDADS